MSETTLQIKIQRIKVEQIADEDADASYVGEWTDNPEAGAIIRWGEYAGKFVRDIPADQIPDKSREYRFFLPTMTGEETGNMESPVQDWQRMEALNNGHWFFLGIRATAEIVIGNTCQTIRSGGLWGIESDSGQEYFDEVAKDELATLSDQLAALGIPQTDIDAAIKAVEL